MQASNKTVGKFVPTYFQPRIIIYSIKSKACHWYKKYKKKSCTDTANDAFVVKG